MYSASYSSEQQERERARAAQARDRARRRERVRRLSLADFAGRTQIEVPNGSEVATVPFVLWPAQKDVLAAMADERLAVFLKARQIGLSWLACLYAMRRCALYPGYPVLCLSRGQLEANELVHRISFMYHKHADRADMSPLIKDNTADLEWANGSSVTSLAATKNAGRSLTAALAILDEWAFMQWPRETLNSVKPTIDAGGQLFIISSADGLGSEYHQFCEHAKAGANGYKFIFLPWFVRPDRTEVANWREQKIIEANGDTASVLREYPANDIEAFSAAVGLVYDVWSDGPDGGNVTEDADYVPDAGPVLWAADDGYEGLKDAQTGQFTADSSPRVILLMQERADGSLRIFDESYEVKTLPEDQIGRVQSLPYPEPDYATVDSAAAELRGRLRAIGIGTYGKPNDIEESIKVTRRFIAADANGRRRVYVHPRCKHLRFEMASYRRDDKGNPIDAHNHGPDALRYQCWKLRNS